MILDCDEIIEARLWVGSCVRVEEVVFLQQLGITAVLNLQSDRDFKDSGIPLQALSRAYDTAGIELRRIPTLDYSKSALAANLAPAVEELGKALLPDGSKVYIHCTAGVNRAPTVVAAYLIKSQGLSASDACGYVCMRRSCSPFLDLLEAYEANLGIPKRQTLI